MVTAMKIDFVSDVSCPWCAVGLNALEQALAEIRGEISVDLHFQPFELNPQMPVEGQDIDEHIAQKYGATPEQMVANRENIRQRGAEVGFTFGEGKRSRIYNTFDAHRLLHWAEEEGSQRELKHALLEAYFTRGENPSDHAVLLAVVESVGLEPSRAAAILGSDEYADEVRERERKYLAQALRQVAAGA